MEGREKQLFICSGVVLLRGWESRTWGGVEGRPEGFLVHSTSEGIAG